MYGFGNEISSPDDNLENNLKYYIIDKINKLCEEDLYYLLLIINNTTRVNEYSDK